MSTPVIEQLAVGPMMNFAYLLGDAEAKVCAVIDPGWEAERIRAAAERAGWQIEKILLTHGHYDHAGETLTQIARETGAPVVVHEAERGEVSEGIETITTQEGSTIPLGSFTIRCLHTPGHSPGSQCFLVGNALFTGDTLFAGNCGRVDLPGGDPKAMFASLKRLAELPPETVVYPGHDYGGARSTIGDERTNNPYMNASSERMLL